jgi:hypothetical protein
VFGFDPSVAQSFSRFRSKEQNLLAFGGKRYLYDGRNRFAPRNPFFNFGANFGSNISLSRQPLSVRSVFS